VGTSAVAAAGSQEAQGLPNFTTCLMASEAGASSPPLVDSHGEPSASGFDMYACTSRTYAGRRMKRLTRRVGLDLRDAARQDGRC